MKILRLGLIFTIILAGLWILSKQTNVFPIHDFVEYWASGKLNFSGGDPYNANQMLQLEQSVGWKYPDVQMMWNPPWTLPLAMFLGMFSYSFSRMLWFLIQLIVIFICAIILWEIYGGEKKREWIAWIALLAFGPMLQTLKLGQITVLILLGSVGFLFFLRREQYFWAGVMASLVLIKPHLLYLFVAAVVFWSITQRKWKILIGMATAVLVAFAVAWIINPNVVSQYILAVRSYPPEDWITATLGAPLRRLFGSGKFYLQFIPSVFGIIWFFFFWFKRFSSWDWQAILPLLILVSAATTSYGWAFDAAVCVWAVVQIAVLFDFSRWTLPKVFIFTSFWAVSLLNTFLSVSQDWFWWLSSFFLVWYLLAFSYLSKQKKSSIKTTVEGSAL